MHRFWRWILPCYLWTLPMTAVGLFIAFVFYGARSPLWHDGVFTCIGGTSNGVTKIWGRPDAQTLGWVQIFANDACRNETDTRVHECVHVGQAFIFSLVGAGLGLVVGALLGHVLLGLVLGGFGGGAGFPLAYGGAFVIAWARRRGSWQDAYFVNPFEVQAYALQDKYLKSPGSRPWGS